MLYISPASDLWVFFGFHSAEIHFIRVLVFLTLFF